MVLSWSYFLILQIVVFLTYYILRKKKDNFVLNKLFPSKFHFLIINSCIFLTCFLYNIDRQLFCIPVTWAAILIIMFIIAFLILPFINIKNKFLNIISSVCGLGVFISIYILLFARFEYLVFVLFNIPIILIIHVFIRLLKNRYLSNIFDAFYFYPAIVLTPFLLLFQLWRLLKGLPQKRHKLLFITTPILTLIIMLILTLQIKIIIDSNIVIHDYFKCFGSISPSLC